MPDYLNRMINELLILPKETVMKSIDIDNQGRYWLLSNGKLLSVVNEQPYYKYFTDNGKGYYQTEINGKKFYLHRLLAFTFTPDKIKQQFKDFLEVHHLDRNRYNNTLSNLCIVSRKKHKAIHSIWNKLDSWEVIPWEQSRPSRISE